LLDFLLCTLDVLSLRLNLIEASHRSSAESPAKNNKCLVVEALLKGDIQERTSLANKWDGAISEQVS